MVPELHGDIGTIVTLGAVVHLDTFVFACVENVFADVFRHSLTYEVSRVNGSRSTPLTLNHKPGRPATLTPASGVSGIVLSG